MMREHIYPIWIVAVRRGEDGPLEINRVQAAAGKTEEEMARKIFETVTAEGAGVYEAQLLEARMVARHGPLDMANLWPKTR